jgi:hypothetical protein
MELTSKVGRLMICPVVLYACCVLYPIEFCDPYSRNILLFWTWVCPTFLCCIRYLGFILKWRRQGVRMWARLM